MILQRLREMLRYASERDTIAALALKAEARSRKLNGLRVPSASRRRRDLRTVDVIEVLQSTNTLLKRANARPAREPELDDSPEEAPAPEPEPAPQPEPEAAASAQRGGSMEAIQELIAVRDMVLVSGPGEGDDRVQAALGRKLRRAIEKHGVQVLDGDGAFDDRLQKQIDVRATDDPAQDDVVCETIRPGYVLGERVIRPQEVAVYQYEAHQG